MPAWQGYGLLGREQVNYNNLRPTMRERIGAFLKGGGSSSGEAPFVAVQHEMLPMAKWGRRDAAAFFKEGYKLNSAVFACTRALVNGFAEPPLVCYEDETKKNKLAAHPLQTLIKRPNELMGEDEWWKFVITYACTGGNAYGKILPNNGGEPGELWPYHDMVMWPVPAGKRWIDHYRYSLDNGNTGDDIPVEEIVHFKWAIDPEQPWRGLSPLAPVGREVDTDNELTRYLKALLQNDAVPRTIYKPGTDAAPLTQEKRNKLDMEFLAKYSLDNRGRPIYLLPGADIGRLALDLQELAFDALRGVPEARIAAAYGVPAIVAGLNIGLTRSTYSNFEEARKMFTEQTLVPLWKAVASEVQQSLVPLFKTPCYVDFDLSQVRALSENTSIVSTWVIAGWDKGLLTRNQALSRLGEPAIEGVEGDERKAPGPAPIPVSMDGMKGRGVAETKSSDQVGRIEAALRSDMGKLLGKQYAKVADAVEEAA